MRRATRAHFVSIHLRHAIDRLIHLPALPRPSVPSPAGLSSLEAEKAELEAYTALDRKKRALEYTLYSHELARANGDLEALAADRDAASKAGEASRAQAEEKAEAAAAAEAAVASAAETLRSKEADRDAARAGVPRLSTRRVKAAARVRELEAAVAADKKTAAALAAEAAALTSEIEAALAQVEEELLPVEREARAAYETVNAGAWLWYWRSLAAGVGSFGWVADASLPCIVVPCAMSCLFADVVLHVCSHSPPAEHSRLSARLDGLYEKAARGKTFSEW